MKLSTIVSVMMSMMFFSGLMAAETADKADLELVFIEDNSKIDDLAIEESKDQQTYRHTHTRCQIHEYYHECEVWSCESNGSTNLTQNFSCVLVDKYACDVGIDCDEDIRPRSLQGSNTFSSNKKDQDDSGYRPTCHSVSECNQLIADCISVDGDFIPGTHDPYTGAPCTGYCPL